MLNVLRARMDLGNGIEGSEWEAKLLSLPDGGVGQRVQSGRRKLALGRRGLASFFPEKPVALLVLGVSLCKVESKRRKSHVCHRGIKALRLFLNCRANFGYESDSEVLCGPRVDVGYGF